MSSLNRRRKLHARRAGARQVEAQHAEHDVPEFAWASDRSAQQSSTEQASQQPVPAAVLQPIQPVHSRLTSSSTSGAACQLPDEAGFRWISDYIVDEVEQVEHALQRSQLANRPEPGHSQLIVAQQQQQQQQQVQATIKRTVHSSAQLAALAASGANAAARSAVSVAATVAGAATTASAAIGSWFAGEAGSWFAGEAGSWFAGEAGSWFAGEAGSWLDRLLGYDVRLADTVTAAATVQAAATSQPHGQSTSTTIHRVQQLCRRLPWQPQVTAQQPATRFQPRHEPPQQLIPVALQPGSDKQQPQGQSCGAPEAPQQHSNQQLGAGTAGQLLSYIIAAGGAVAVIVHEVADAVATTYTDTLKPAGSVLWQLLAAVSSLVGVLVMYVMLPLLKAAMGVLQRVLFAFTKMLNSCNQHLKRLCAPHAAAGAVPGDSTRRSAAVAGASIATSAQSRGPVSSQKLQLLATAQQQLSAVCRSSPGTFLHFEQLWFGSDLFECPCPTDAGYGPTAFYAGYNSRSVAVQVQILDGPDQIRVWCEAVRTLKDLRHLHVLRFIGATVGVVPRVTICPDATAVGLAAASDNEALVGCLIYEKPHQPRDFMAALKHPSAINHNSRYNFIAPARTGSAAAATAPGAAGAAASSQELRFPPWTDRFQLAIQLASGLHYLCEHTAAQAEVVHAALLHLQGKGVTAGALLSGAAAIVEHVQEAATADVLLEYVHFHSWPGDITMQQLAAAVVVESSADGCALKVNPSLLLLKRQSHGGAAAGVGARSTRDSRRAATDAIPPALGDLVLMLITTGINDTRIAWLEAECSRITLARRLWDLTGPVPISPLCLLPRFEAAEFSNFAVAILRQLVKESATLLAWQLPTELRALQQQQWHIQQHTTGRASYSAAAAERGAQVGSNQQQQAQPGTQASTGAGGAGSMLQLRTQAAANSTAANAGTSSSAQVHFRTTLVTDRTVVAAKVALARAEAVLGYNWDDLLRNLQVITEACTVWQQLQENEAADEEESESMSAVSDMTSTEEEEEEEEEADEQQQQEQQQHMATPAGLPVAGTSSPQSPPSYFICPITSAVMSDPVVAADGYTYERSAITRWLQVARACRSPMTNQPMQPVLVPNHSLRSSIMEWRLQQQQQEPQQQQHQQE